jgi:hypothetical protein
VVRLSALHTGRIYPQEGFLVLIFVKRLSRPQGHNATRRIKSLKNSSDSIGNRTRDLPIYSAVPQPTVPPRTPRIMYTGISECTQPTLCFLCHFSCGYKSHYRESFLRIDWNEEYQSNFTHWSNTNNCWVVINFTSKESFFFLLHQRNLFTDRTWLRVGILFYSLLAAYRIESYIMFESGLYVYVLEDLYC